MCILDWQSGLLVRSPKYTKYIRFDIFYIGHRLYKDFVPNKSVSFNSNQKQKPATNHPGIDNQ